MTTFAIYMGQGTEHSVNYQNYYQNTKIKCRQKTTWFLSSFLFANGVLDVVLSNLSVFLSAVQCMASWVSLQNTFCYYPEDKFFAIIFTTVVF